MKRKTFTTFILTIVLLVPMAIVKPVYSQSGTDTLAPQVITLRDRISGVEDRVATNEADLAKLTKIKLSGYIQAQWQNFEASNIYPNNYFLIRRARIKFTYEPTNGIVFVLQPDFQPGNITIKDAYAQANDRWLKTFSLWAGKFNRPNYEVEYSSSSREVPERSRVVRAIYPDERAIGAKLEIAPPKTKLKVQLAVFNGNDGIALNIPAYNFGTQKWDNVSTVGQNTDFDNYKDFMGRVTYAFKLGHWGGLTIGAHTYIGQIKANSLDVLNSDYSYDKTLSSVGKGIPKNWYGFEAQFYADLLGGLTIKGEYIFGVNSTPGFNGSVKYTTNSSAIINDTLNLTTTTNTSVYKIPAISRNFNGYYIYVIKNVGKRNQIAVRYDFYNPNTDLSADQIGTAKYDAKVADVVKNDKSYTGADPVVSTNNQSKTTTVNKLTSGTADIPYGTWTFAYTYFFDENIKFMIGYEIPMNKKVGIVDPKTNTGNVTSPYTVNNVTSSYDYSNVIKQNILTVRMQVKF
jgi:hypothetical protein